MKKKKYLVDVFHTYAKTVEIEAQDEHEAERIAFEMDSQRKIDPADFKKTDDVDCVCHGYVDENGERVFD